MSERKWRQPQLQLRLVTKFRGRRELGLSTCLLQFILGKWCHVRCSELCKLFVNGRFWGAQIHLFIIFICSLYSPWATIKLLHHQFWLCRCVNFRLCCTHFSCHRHKMCNVSRWLTQISRRQCDPCKLICVNVTCKACTEYNCDQSSVCTLWSQLYSVQALLDLHMPENKIEALWRMCCCMCCHYHEYVLQPLFSNSVLHLKM